MKSPAPSAVATELKLLSVVIPARDEEGCIASTVEHLHVELRLNNVPHEIIVVDDGSTDRTAQIVTQLGQRIPEVAPALEWSTAWLWARHRCRPHANATATPRSS